ncbi:glycine zipper domain-containing protein [Iodidimonas sp. SYSU 1G8]|uniref:glycine zipper domain-containing protein n=1 Tax=Iodidimonas sp. SYSU 1G8 TaxID=3133967 RepID=UPI0031FE5108
MKKIIAVVMCAGLLAACESDGYGSDNEAVGTIVGAGLGAALGSTAHGSAKGPTMILGALVGGAIGNRVGARLDERDRMRHERASYQALEYGRSYETSGWYDPDRGTRGAITPRPSYRNDRGLQCREYQQEIWIGGRREEGYGTACRQPDGSWQIMGS